MVKYYCEKCGIEIEEKTNRVNVTFAFSNDTKKLIHLCRDCYRKVFTCATTTEVVETHPTKEAAPKITHPAEDPMESTVIKEILAELKTPKKCGNTLPDGTVDEIVKRYNNGDKINEISAELGIPYASCYYYARKVGKR